MRLNIPDCEDIITKRLKNTYGAIDGEIETFEMSTNKTNKNAEFSEKNTFF